MKTLLEATVLAAVPLSFVDFAVAVSHAIVDAFVLYGSLKETLATERKVVSFSPSVMVLFPAVCGRKVTFTCSTFQ